MGLRRTWFEKRFENERGRHADTRPTNSRLDEVGAHNAHNGRSSKSGARYCGSESCVEILPARKKSDYARILSAGHEGRPM